MGFGLGMGLGLTLVFVVLDLYPALLAPPPPKKKTQQQRIWLIIASEITIWIRYRVRFNISVCCPLHPTPFSPPPPPKKKKKKKKQGTINLGGNDF